MKITLLLDRQRPRRRAPPFTGELSSAKRETEGGVRNSPLPLAALATSPANGGGLPFWKTKTLAEMNEAEWESLCDRCGKCCVISIEDADTGELYLTDVSCKLFDTKACGCGDYANRKKLVPDCVKLTPKNVPKLDWLPHTCAYRIVSEGRDLHWWHPLVSGDPETVHIARGSARNRTRPEGRLKMSGLIKRITTWPQPLEKPPAKARRRTRGKSPSRPRGRSD